MEDNFITHAKIIRDVLIIKRPTFPDDRGLFREPFRLNDLEKELGHEFNICQWNHAVSKPKVIRGLHAENWNKLVYLATGKSTSFLVDIRPESETFGKVEKIELDESDLQALYIPKGVANSICVVSENEVNYMYLVDAYYDGKDTTAIAWDDPDLNIDWPIKDPVISERDRNNPKLRDLFPEKFK
jgi:dTDP-4-dehydrorhamnose 3,5-epimerase